VPKTPGWLVQDPTTKPIGDLIPTIGGSGAHQGRAGTREEPGTSTLLDFGVVIRGNVIIRKARRAIQADDFRPRRRSSSRFSPV